MIKPKEYDLVVRTVEAINLFMSQHSWLDFDLAKINSSKISFGGRVSQSYDTFPISINFEYPLFIQAPLDFTFNVEVGDFIILVGEDEKKKMCDIYELEYASYLFKLRTTSSFRSQPQEYFILSKGIDYELG